MPQTTVSWRWSHKHSVTVVWLGTAPSAVHWKKGQWQQAQTENSWLPLRRNLVQIQTQGFLFTQNCFPVISCTQKLISSGDVDVCTQSLAPCEISVLGGGLSACNDVVHEYSELAKKVGHICMHYCTLLLLPLTLLQLLPCFPLAFFSFLPGTGTIQLDIHWLKEPTFIFCCCEVFLLQLSYSKWWCNLTVSLKIIVNKVVCLSV